MALCIETSAKQRVNVDEAFIAVVRAIRRYQKVCPDSKTPTLGHKADNQESGPPLDAVAPGRAPANDAGGRPAKRADDHVDKGCCGSCVIL